MLYEYQCTKGHVIEATVKLNGEGTPASCTASVWAGSVGFASPFDDADDPDNWQPCGAPLRRILSLTSGYFPGAGSWRGA